MNLQDVSHIHIPDGDVRMIHDSDNRLLWGAVGYNVLFSGNTFQQSYTGKNLFDDNTATDAYIQSNGTVTPNSAWRSSQLIKVEPNTRYIWHGEVYGIHQVVWAGYDSSRAFVSGQYAQVNNVTSLVIVTGENTEYLRVGYRSDGMRNMQLELGSTATSFEPYVGGQASPSPEYPQQIQTVTGKQTVKVLGKNLLNITSPVREITKAGLHMTIADDGKITIDGTATGATWPDFIWGIQSNAAIRNSCKYYFPKALEAVTYSIKIVNGTVTDSPIITVVFNDDARKNVGNKLDQPQAKTVTGVNGINIVYLNNIQSGTTFNNFQFYLQIESGATATEVVPYSELDSEIDLGDIELCKLGNYQDYIWKDGEDWKVHKATVSAIIDGSENWSASGTNTFYVANIYSKIGNSIQSTSTGEMYASHFTIVDISSSNTLVGASLKVDAAHNLSNLRIRLQDMSGHTAGFRQMLSAKKPSIYARRLTPTDTTITDTNLIAQLEAIYNLARRYGHNFVVSASGNNLPIIIDRTLL